MVTEVDCAVVMPVADGVTVTEGVILVTVTMPDPDPELYVEELAESGV
jgi:hypothetical protein